MDKWPNEVIHLVELALAEDTGSGDITTQAIFTGKEKGTARLIAKESGVLCGLKLADLVMRQTTIPSAQITDGTALSGLPGEGYGPVAFEAFRKDGDFIKEGETLARWSGALPSILLAERTMLNFLQRMSGIATRTRQYAEALQGTGTKILDTRKTAPGHRYLDKMAVRCGGGTNHRMCLDDRFLIKENHIRMAGGVKSAIERCHEYRKKKNLPAKIEIEVTSLHELEQVLLCEGVDYIMLDNMDTDLMRKAVALVAGRCYTEASGNVIYERLPEIARTGVDYISSGALTHSVKALDMTLLIESDTG